FLKVTCPPGTHSWQATVALIRLYRQQSISSTITRTFYMRTIFFALLLLPAVSTFSQRYMAEGGMISFYSDAPVEDITATNQNVTSIFTASTGAMAFSVPVRDFEFEKKLMKEHFNDKYMESDRFPRSTFSGAIIGYSMNASGPQRVRAKGKLTIHGIVHEIDVPGSFEVKDG